MDSHTLTTLCLLVFIISAAAGPASPFDKLDAAAIDEDDRKALGIPELVAFMRPHDRAVAHVAISRDSKFIASSGWDNVVHIQKLGGKESVSWAKLAGSPSGIAFSPDGKWLAAGCGDTRVMIWDVTGEKPKQKHALAGHKNRPFVLAFSPNGKMFASGCFDPVLRIWKLDDPDDPEAWGILANEQVPSVGLSSMAFSHNGKFLVAGSHVGKETLRIWEASGAFLDERTLPPTKGRTVACSPTEPLLAFAGDDVEIHLWKPGEKIEKVRKFPGHTGKALPPIVKALAFSPDGKSIASCGQDKLVRLWSVRSGEKQREWQLNVEPRALAFAADGRHLVIGNSDGTVYVLRLK